MLAVSLTGFDLLRPLYDASGSEVMDFLLAYLNLVAQRPTGLGEQPGGTIRARFLTRLSTAPLPCIPA